LEIRHGSLPSADPMSRVAGTGKRMYPWMMCGRLYGVDSVEHKRPGGMTAVNLDRNDDLGQGMKSSIADAVGKSSIPGLAEQSSLKLKFWEDRDLLQGGPGSLGPGRRLL
jgi:hypothetical protein